MHLRVLLCWATVISHCLAQDIYIFDVDSLQQEMMQVVDPQNKNPVPQDKIHEYLKENDIGKPIISSIRKLHRRNSAAIFLFVASGKAAQDTAGELVKLSGLAGRGQPLRRFNRPRPVGLREQMKSFKKRDVVLIRKKVQDPMPFFYGNKPQHPITSYLFTLDDPQIMAIGDDKILLSERARSFSRRFLVRLHSNDVIGRRYPLYKRWSRIKKHPLGHLKTNWKKHQFNQTNNRTLNVLSYNILLSGLDQQGHEWASRVKAVTQLIKQHDLAGLQEVSGQQLDDLMNILPDYNFCRVNSMTGAVLEKTDNPIWEGMVIAYKKEMFDLKSHHYWWISPTPVLPSSFKNSDFPSGYKMTQRVELVYKPTSTPIVFYNNHFPHGRVKSKDQDPRTLAANMEIAYLYQDLRKDIFPISVGDRNFQTGRDEENYQCYLKIPGLSDASLEANYGLGTTILGFKDTPFSMELDKDGKEKSNNLDVIFYGSAFAKVSHCTIHPVEYDDNGDLLSLGPVQDPQSRRFGSDHAAVSVQFRLL